MGILNLNRNAEKARNCVIFTGSRWLFILNHLEPISRICVLFSTLYFRIINRREFFVWNEPFFTVDTLATGKRSNRSKGNAAYAKNSQKLRGSTSSLSTSTERPLEHQPTTATNSSKWSPTAKTAAGAGTPRAAETYPAGFYKIFLLDHESTWPCRRSKEIF